MSLQDTLKLIIKEQGKEMLQKPELLAVLEDYQAYSSESPATRVIMHQLVRYGLIRSLMVTSKRGAEFQSEIKSIVSQIAALGFKDDAVSDVVKAIVFASGKMTQASEWPKALDPQKPPVVVHQKNSVVKARQQATKSSAWNRLKKWLWFNSDGIFVVLLIGTSIFTVITLFLTLVGWVNDSPEVGYWAKEFLVCLISTIVIFFVYAFSDERGYKESSDRNTNMIPIIWCLLMLACVVTCVIGFWMLFAGTISYGGACWMIFPSIILGGVLWIFNELF